MTAGAVGLLLGITGFVFAAIGSVIAIARARRSVRRTGGLSRSLLVLPLVLGAVLLLSIAAIVVTVVLG